MSAALKKEAEAARARLEAQADAILERDAALLRDLGVHADALRRCYEELMLPRNDPEYLRTLEEHEKDRTSVANVTASVHHVIDGGRSWLSIGMTDQRNHARRKLPGCLAATSRRPCTAMRTPRNSRGLRIGRNVRRRGVRSGARSAQNRGEQS